MRDQKSRPHYPQHGRDFVLEVHYVKRRSGAVIGVGNRRQMSEDGTSGATDPVRRLMEMVAERSAKLAEITNPSEVTEVELTEQAQAAAEIATTVLAADPATGPVDVIYIGPNDDVTDRRFLLLLFGGESAFLFDRDAGRTSPLS